MGRRDVRAMEKNKMVRFMVAFSLQRGKFQTREKQVSYMCTHARPLSSKQSVPDCVVRNRTARKAAGCTCSVLASTRDPGYNLPIHGSLGHNPWSISSQEWTGNKTSDGRIEPSCKFRLLGLRLVVRKPSQETIGGVIGQSVGCHGVDFCPG